MTEIPVSALSEATIEGSGVFDVLMRANKAHLEAEFAKNRIKGPEYSTVYLGALQQVLAASVQFVLGQQKAAQEAALIEKQILLTEVSITKAEAEADQIVAQTGLFVSQRSKVEDDILSGALQRAQLDAQTGLINQQKDNAVLTGNNLIKEGCKLDAEFDVLMAQSLKVSGETTLLAQKTATERAQTSGVGVDENSIVGRQKLLYHAQTEGFKRSSENAAAKLLVDSWAVRRTTDEGTVADGNNKLDDATIGRAVNKMLSGVGA